MKIKCIKSNNTKHFTTGKTYVVYNKGSIITDCGSSGWQFEGKTYIPDGYEVYGCTWKMANKIYEIY